jgi:hypothetical protein
MTIEEMLSLTGPQLDALAREELAQLQRKCLQHIAALQQLRQNLLAMYQAKETEAAAANVVRKLTPERRAALKRELERQEAEEAAQYAAEQALVANLAANAAADAAQANADALKVVAEPADPLTLTDAQRSAILLAQEVK